MAVEGVDQQRSELWFVKRWGQPAPQVPCT